MKKCFKEDCQKTPTFSCYNRRNKKTIYACEEHKREVKTYNDNIFGFKSSGYISK